MPLDPTSSTTGEFAGRDPLTNRRRRFGIRARVVLLVVAVTVPFLSLSFLRGAERREMDRGTTEERAQLTADLVASRVSARIDEARSLITALGPTVRFNVAHTEANDELLERLARDLPRGFTSLHLSMPSGENVGTSYRPIGDRDRLNTTRRAWHAEAMRRRRLVIGEPVRSSTDSTIWVVSFVQPALNADSTIRGFVVATLRLGELSRTLTEGPISDRVITILSGELKILARSVDTETWVGRQLPAISSATLPRVNRGIFEGRSVNDEPLLVATSIIEGTAWRVFVGFPHDRVFAAAQQESRRDLFIVLASLGVALLAAVIIAGRLVRPIRELAADAEAIEQGDLSRRSAVRSRHEVGALARTFNRMAASLESRQRALVASEERARALFDLSPLPTWLYDRETLEFRYVNDAAVQLFGWSREEFGSMRITDVALATADRATIERDIRGNFGAAARRQEWQNRTRDGRALHLIGNGVDAEWDRRPVRVEVLDDVTDRRRAEEALAASQAQLRQVQKVEAVGSLTAGVAHDFNNLLTGILGSCDLALAELESTHPAREELQQIRETAVRAAEVTRRLLAFSRQRTASLDRINLSDVVTGMSKMLTRMLGETVRLQIRASREPLSIVADHAQMEQVLLNLLVNARDAMPRGGNVTVETRRARAEDEPPAGNATGWVILAVTDTGEGMDPTTVARIFEPFFTTKPPGRGTGLGLSITDGIVRSAGGEIGVRSAKGSGTTLRIFLPEVPEEVTKRASPMLGTPRAIGETVLLTEDDASVRRVAQRMLEQLGYVVLAAANAREALDIARDHIGTIHLLLTDVVMPGMNGRELADAMARLRPATKVVFASGYTDDSALLEGLRNGRLPFIQKPFTSESIARTLRVTLDTASES